MGDSALELLERIKRKAPEYYDLLTAETDAEFQSAFDAILGKAVSRLEQNKRNFSSLDEEALSAALGNALDIPGLTVTHETNSNGHVDLTIDADHCLPARRILGEAKIFRGPAYHFKGLEQLLGRYSTGREGRGLLITYFRVDNITGQVKILREKMDADRPMKQTKDTIDHILKWSFISSHLHSCGDAIDVGHIGCNLYVDGA